MLRLLLFHGSHKLGYRAQKVCEESNSGVSARSIEESNSVVCARSIKKKKKNFKAQTNYKNKALNNIYI